MGRITRRNSTLAKKIATLELRLAPLVPLPTGSPHPAFPKTLMAYHLLSEEDLDALASYYHQSTPGPWTYHYPAPMNWDKDFLAKVPSSPLHAVSAQDRYRNASATNNSCVPLSDEDRLRIKRRKVGKFIGLVGMETPQEEIMGRIRANVQRALARRREELERNGVILMRRRKML